MTQESIKKEYYYDNGKLISRKHKRELGWLHPKGYKYFRVEGKAQKVHRAIWIYHNGSIPNNMQIDHINGNKLDNKIENLRIVTNIENSMNRGIQSNNTTGYHGITLQNGRYRTRINVNKKRISLGMYDTFEEAYKVRKEAEEKYGYHKNHGRK